MGAAAVAGRGRPARRAGARRHVGGGWGAAPAHSPTCRASGGPLHGPSTADRLHGHSLRRARTRRGGLRHLRAGRDARRGAAACEPHRSHSRAVPDRRRARWASGRSPASSAISSRRGVGYDWGVRRRAHSDRRRRCHRRPVGRRRSHPSGSGVGGESAARRQAPRQSPRAASAQAPAPRSARCSRSRGLGGMKGGVGSGGVPPRRRHRRGVLGRQRRGRHPRLAQRTHRRRRTNRRRLGVREQRRDAAAGPRDEAQLRAFSTTSRSAPPR